MSPTFLTDMMDGERLLAERTARGWPQAGAAARLGVSQPYLSLIEAGRRPVTGALARRAARVFKLPPTALPFGPAATTSGQGDAGEKLAAQLAGLGYPGFSHLRKARRTNPASVLIAALGEDELDGRVVEALVWLVSAFPDLDWPRVVGAAKLADAQNRLGFLVSLARGRAVRENDARKKRVLHGVLSGLERSKLARDDSFRRASLTGAERAWLRKHRPAEARRWRVLSNLTP